MGQCWKRLLNVSSQPTLHVNHVPAMFREPYIIRGYRPINKPWSYYLLSACHLHNETLNVWTHVFAFLIILLQLCRLLAVFDWRTDKDTQTLVGFCLGCLLNNLLSASAHLLHSKSPWWHYVWFLIDYAGVTYNSFATVLGCVYVSSHPAVYRLIEPYILPINVALSSFAFLVCCLAKLHLTSPHQQGRQLLMVGALGFHAFLGSVPVLGRYVDCFYDDSCSFHSLNHVSVVFILLALCAVMFSAHVPEKLWHGQFDIFGHGHQIFHVFTMVTTLMELEGMRIDIQNGAARHTSPDLYNMLTAYAVLVFIHASILVSLLGQVQKNINDVMQYSKCQ